VTKVCGCNRDQCFFPAVFLLCLELPQRASGPVKLRKKGKALKAVSRSATVVSAGGFAHVVTPVQANSLCVGSTLRCVRRRVVLAPRRRFVGISVSTRGDCGERRVQVSSSVWQKKLVLCHRGDTRLEVAAT